MSNKRYNRYANLSNEALRKLGANVRNTRRRGQIHNTLSRRGSDA
jgi:hypothetical protein